MTPKEQLQKKLQEMEEGLRGPQKTPDPVPFVENLLDKSSRRIGKGIQEAQKERAEAEEKLKRYEEMKVNSWNNLQQFKILCSVLKEKKDLNWKEEYLKEAFGLTEEELKNISYSTDKQGNIKIECRTGRGALCSIQGSPEEIQNFVDEFKQDVLSGGANSENSHKNYIALLDQWTEEEKKILQKKTFNISKKTGRKEERQLSLPLLPEVLKVSKKEQGFLMSGEDERIKTFIAQKVGLIKGKDEEGLKKLSEIQILSIEEVKKVCKVGKQKAYDILQTFSKVNFQAPILIESKDKGEEGQLIHYLKLGLKKNGTERDYLKPKLSLDALMYLQENGQKSFLPAVDSPEVSALNNFSFKLLKTLGRIQHNIEGHFPKALPEELWLQVNIRVLYEDFLQEETASTNGHNNRLKEKFLTALTELTENGHFKKAPFLSLPYLTKKGLPNRIPRISDPPEFMKEYIKTTLKGMKKAGTEWEDILKGSLLFCLSFRSMAEKDHERIVSGIEAKRKKKYSKLQAMKTKAPKTTKTKKNKAPEAPEGFQGATDPLQDEELFFPEVEGDSLKK